jgi:uncharacterized peroxidase-related enzyme
MSVAAFPVLANPESATDPVVCQVFAEIQQELGFGIVPNIFRSMAHNPPLLAANWQKFKHTILQGALPRTVKEMIGVIVSNRNRSGYARMVHLHSLSVQGVHALWLRHLTDPESDDSSLPDTLRAIIAFTRQAARDPQGLTSGHYRALEEAGVSDAELHEVIATIDLFQSVNAYTDLARVPIDRI